MKPLDKRFAKELINDLSTMNDTKPKVYCKNCKYGGDFFANSLTYQNGIKGWRWCEFPDIEITDDNEYLIGSAYTGIVTSKRKNRTSVKRKSEINPDGECTWYKRKRWKFWIKN